LINEYINKIICGDSLNVMKQMPSNSIDLVVTSPPYNLEKSERRNQFCNHCGDSVAKGSGKFVNRIPDFNDISTRIVNKLEFPLGDFVCNDCDNNSLTDNE